MGESEELMSQRREWNKGLKLRSAQEKERMEPMDKRRGKRNVE